MGILAGQFESICRKTNGENIMTQIFLVTFGFLLFPAHEMPGGAGAIEGFLHPLLGLDHLLAMVTVGLLSAQMGGRAIWTVPVSFVSVMALGGLLGIMGIELPAVEYAIAVSVIVLGIALVARARMPELVAMAFVGFFALFHGFAHGAEMPQVTGDSMFLVAYVVGFLTATAGLHVIGALLGYIALRRPPGTLVLRLAGVFVALLGTYILFSLA
jgi:urease accessory protein